MSDKQDWKHGRWTSQAGKPDAVAIFDDDSEDCDSIYLRHGAAFVPCRTVDRSLPDHWKNVLLAWSSHAPLEDHRLSKTIPLP